MSQAPSVSEILNNSGLAKDLMGCHKVMVKTLARILSQKLDREKEMDAKEYDQFLLNNIGPAAAASAIDTAITTCRSEGRFSNLNFNGSPVTNAKLVMNEPMEGYQNFSNVLRQFLLPRYAYLDFDRVVDPRHMIDEECGYPKFITPIMYRYMYDRDDVASRVVNLYPNESWAQSPMISESEDGDQGKAKTPFEQDWEDLKQAYNMEQMLYRIDKLAGIGHYGALLLGVDDGQDLEKPIEEPELLAGHKRSVGRKQRRLLYMRPFDEYLSFIHQYETDVLHPRYGLPKFYNLVFLDMTIDAAGASIGTRLNRRVHWTRVVHVADNLHSSLVFGVPRMQPVFNRLLDLRKIKGGSAEMLWKGGFPGISFEIDPQYVADDPEFDRDSLRKEIMEYSNGMQRYLALVGVKANTLNPNIADPKEHVRLQLEAIAMYMDSPLRVFMGSEEGRLASSQDKLTWNIRLGRRLKMFVEPYILRNVIDRFVAIGIMHPPSSARYFVGWDDLNTPTDEDRANLALKYSQAISQYVSTGMIHLIKPMDYFTIIVGLKPNVAKRIVDAVGEDGWTKLKGVDPSQGSGENGIRKNTVSKGSKEGTSGERPKPRNTADKKTEGDAS